MATDEYIVCLKYRKSVCLSKKVIKIIFYSRIFFSQNNFFFVCIKQKNKNPLENFMLKFKYFYHLY